MATTPIQELVYVSAALSPMPASELAKLLLKARANNQGLGVSGMLVHQEGSFFQVLEGAPEVVEHLYNVIARDKRHGRVIVLSRSEISERNFGDWSMGFVEGKDAALAKLPGFNDFFRKGFGLSQLSDKPAKVKDLMLAFRDGRFRQHIHA